jgi:RimJ/RimL family protein N-acetyltransferase
MSAKKQNNAQLSVRPLELADISYIVNYWTTASVEFLNSMGADPAKMPSAAQFEKNLKQVCAANNREKKADYLIWLVDGNAVGFSSLKNIAFGESGEMHLHIWDSSLRGKGYGAILFSLAAVDFYRRFELKKIKCEPSAANPLPNKMLQKIGFPCVRKWIGASSELSQVCELSEYDIRRDVAEKYLMDKS